MQVFLRQLLVFIVAATALAFPADVLAGIISFSGSIESVDSSLVPSDIREGAWENNTNVRLFEERQNFATSTDLILDIVSPGTYGRTFGFTPASQLLSSNSMVNSYYLHFDPVGTPANTTRSGFVAFDVPILGVIVGVLNGVNQTAPANTLGLSNPITGLPGVTYGFAAADLFTGGGDQIAMSGDRQSLTFTLISGVGSDSIRIITAVPEPSSWMLGVFAGFLPLFRRQRRRTFQ